MDLNDLVKQIEALADSEKLALVDIILSKLDKPDPEIDSVWANETRNRWKAYKAGNIGAVAYEQVMDKHRTA
jgi:putative addiction module component (TIGR02574 family)